MAILQTSKDFLTGKYLPITYNQLNYSCFTNLKDSSTAPNYLRNLAAQVNAITEFAAPWAKDVVNTSIHGYFVYEVSRAITAVVMKNLPDEISSRFKNSRLLEKMERIRSLITYSACLGVFVGPITPLSFLLLASAGAVSGATSHRRSEWGR